MGKYYVPVLEELDNSQWKFEEGILFNKASEAQSLKLFSLDGILIEKYNVPAHENFELKNILGAGVYLIHLSTGDVLKFILN